MWCKVHARCSLNPSLPSPVFSSIFFGLLFFIRDLTYFLPDSAIRALLRRAPSPNVKRIMQISDTMARRSEEIIAERKVALAKGDAALAQEVGEGKDLMSICRESCAY